MKKTATICLALITICMFSQCAGQKNLVKKSPVTFGEVTLESWRGVKNPKKTGISLYINIEEENGVQLQDVYFRGQQVKLDKIKKGSHLLYIARFEDVPTKKDMVMHQDPAQEYGNTMPETHKNKFPFTLKDNEAVVSFIKNDEIKYYKIEGIKTIDNVMEHKEY
ncbi:hypothetical protein ACG2LH_03310 [Zhouia sp. PK063]|uniref:hypothetical protein n=1 Tax=Zhouia sp. PK063 TaxID=3373602 RepID=UPI0037B908A1